MIRKIRFATALTVAIFAGPVAAQTVEYMHTDALGSVVAITDSGGAVVDRNQFEPYGGDLTGIKDGPGYTGHVSDAATGLSYMEQRYYDPQIGRFLSVDPVPAEGTSGGNFNRYWYANNHPYKFTDPDGRLATCNQSSCAIDCVSAITCTASYAYVGIIYTKRMIENALTPPQQQEVESDNDTENNGNTNPYDGPIDEPVTVVDGDGNAIPVEAGEQVTSSPDGRYQQVRDRDGKPTGTRIDKGGHKGQSDPQAQGPHAHRPGVTDDSGNPHLPINEPKPTPEG